MESLFKTDLHILWFSDNDIADGAWGCPYFLSCTAKTTVGKNGGKRCGGHAAPSSGNADKRRAGTASSHGGKGAELNPDYFGGFPLI
jgi:hypothetical protein